MSQDAKYIIELEGPFGVKEIEDRIDEIKELLPVIKIASVAYGTLFFETKHIQDEEVAGYAKRIGALEALSCWEEGRWKFIYQYHT